MELLLIYLSSSINFSVAIQSSSAACHPRHQTIPFSVLHDNGSVIDSLTGISAILFRILWELEEMFRSGRSKSVSRLDDLAHML